MSTTQPEALHIADLESQLSSSGYTAADMATAAAQGFRDGVASVAASAGSEPVAIYHGRCVIDCGAHGHLDMDLLYMVPAGTKIYTHPSPPEGMVGGWRPMADAPRDGTLILAAIYIHSSDGTEEWQRHAIYFDDERDCTYFDGGDDTGWEFDDYEFWTPLLPPPTSLRIAERGSDG